MDSPNVLIIDAGLGNIGSVFNSFKRQECCLQKLQEPPPHDSLDNFTHVVLPGVGTFFAGMKALKVSGWDTWIKEIWFPSGKPFLGICLGMQLLATEGTEGVPNQQNILGLDIIPGSILPFETKLEMLLPHIGWNSLSGINNSSLLTSSIPEGGDMYFVHSYLFSPLFAKHSLASTEYGSHFSSIVGRGNCFGVQFHPEKSQRLGSLLLRNFLSLTPC